MLLLFGIIYFLSHQHHPEHWAVDAWTWIAHHVLLTIIVLLVGL